jgi:hypothetical protein
MGILDEEDSGALQKSTKFGKPTQKKMEKNRKETGRVSSGLLYTLAC